MIFLKIGFKICDFLKTCHFRALHALQQLAAGIVVDAAHLREEALVRAAVEGEAEVGHQHGLGQLRGIGHVSCRALSNRCRSLKTLMLLVEVR